MTIVITPNIVLVSEYVRMSCYLSLIMSFLSHNERYDFLTLLSHTHIIDVRVLDYNLPFTLLLLRMLHGELHD